MNQVQRMAVLWVLMLVMAILVIACAGLQKDAGFSWTPAREFLHAQQTPQAGYGAYGYLLFTRRLAPASFDKPSRLAQRYRAVCETFLFELESVGFYRDIEKSRLMPTFWMLAKRVPQAEFVAKNVRFGAMTGGWPAACRRLITAYDFARAELLLSAVYKLGVEGPVLVAWQDPHSMQAAEALVLDLSDFSQDDFRRAFQIWQTHIAKDPSAWKNGFNVVLIREAFRNFIQAYGTNILRVVQRSMPLLNRILSES